MLQYFARSVYTQKKKWKHCLGLDCKSVFKKISKLDLIEYFWVFSKSLVWDCTPTLDNLSLSFWKPLLWLVPSSGFSAVFWTFKSKLWLNCLRTSESCPKPSCCFLDCMIQATVSLKGKPLPWVNAPDEVFHFTVKLKCCWWGGPSGRFWMAFEALRIGFMPLPWSCVMQTYWPADFMALYVESRPGTVIKFSTGWLIQAKQDLQPTWP